jgi:hypothetical protein
VEVENVMMNLKKSFILSSVLFVMIFSVLSQPVSASSGKKMIEGSGKLSAAGVGVAILQGDGEITISGKGIGVIWIKGAEKILAQGDGQKYEYKNGILYIGWKGTVYASGSAMNIHIEGGFIKFTAEGEGSALLKGKGVYHINEYSGLWT